MFCGKCGKPIPEGQQYCDCSNPGAAAPVDLSFTLNTPEKGQKSKPMKKKGGKGPLIIVAVLLVAVIALGVVFWGNISRFFMRNFGDPAEYLQDVEEDNVAAVASDIAAVYDKTLANPNIENPAVDYTIKLQCGDSLMALLQTVMEQNGMSMDLSWVDSISLTPYVAMYDNVLRCDVGVGLNDVTVGTASVIWDMNSNMMYVGMPELSSTYIELDMTDLTGMSANDMAAIFAESQAMALELQKCMPTSKQVEDLIVKYAGIILNSISEAEKENRTVEAGDLEQDLLVITFDLSQKDILKIVSNVLKEAKKDKTIEDILENVDDYLEESTGYRAYLYDSFAEGVEYALENIEYGMDEVSTRSFLTIETFLDKKDNIVGYTFTVKDGGEKMSLYYITVTEGKEWAFEAELAEISITGEGTVDGDSRSGSYLVNVSGTDLLTLELKKWNGTTGTIRLIPESMVYDMMGIYGPFGSLLDQAALAVTLTENSVTLALEVGTETFLAMTVSGEITEANRISLPDSISVEDNYAAQEWLSKLDFDNVLNNLRKSGVPGQYMDAAEQLVDMLLAQLN